MFIKFTEVCKGKEHETYISYQHISSCQSDYQLNDLTQVTTSNGFSYFVKGTIEEIMALIEQSKFKVTSGTVTTYSPMTFSAEV